MQAANENLRQLVVAYQEMIGEGLDVSIVFAGLPAAISSMLNDHVLTFLNRAAMPAWVGKLGCPDIQKALDPGGDR